MDKIETYNPQRLAKRVRWFLSFLALGFLYYELFIHHDAGQILKYTEHAFVTNPWPLLIVLFLMPFNWGLETIKWRYLMSKIHPITFKNSIKGVLMGVSVGLFTPNGIGEFAGRMLVVKDRYRQGSISASIAGNMAQLAITITIGGACIVFFVGKLISKELVPVAVICALATVAIGFYLYFKMANVANFLFHKLTWFNRYKQFVDSFQNFDSRTLLIAYLLSLLRYFVFCLQIYILARYTVEYIPEISSITLFFMMPVYFYIQTLIPTIAVAEIGVRGAVLTFLLPSAAYETSLIMSTTIIWIINIILPALIGLSLTFISNLKSESA